MKHFRWWALCLAWVPALGALAAKPELHLDRVHVGKSEYSNAVFTASGTNRVAVEHSLGLATIKTAALEIELAHQLLAAGVIQESALQGNTNFQAFLKQERLSEKQRQRAANPQGLLAQHAGMEGSLGARLGELLEQEARARGGADPVSYVESFGPKVALAILGGSVFFYFFRCWGFSRLVKKSTGRGSWLVILPLLRWLPLLRAAGMSLHLLWLPLLGLAMLYCQPPLPEQVPWAGAAYHFLTLGIWALTALLFAVWCVKICGKAGGNPLLGLLFIIPVLDWVVLLYLAFSGGGEAKPSTPRPGQSGSARPVFALV